MIVQNGECISTDFVFTEHFAWLCKINFHFSLGVLQPKPILFHFAWLCENFAWSCEIEKHVFFSTPLFNFSHFFIFNSPPPPSIQLQSLVQVHFLFLIIHSVSLLHSIFHLSLNASKITLIYLQNLTKNH